MTKHPKTQRSPKDQILTAEGSGWSATGRTATNEVRGNSEFPFSLGLSCFAIPSCLGSSNFDFPIAFISPGGGELILIMLVLILLFGAKDAPRIFRSIHTFLDKMQRMAADFRYKIMYGDLYSKTTDEAPYDVEAECPEDAPDPLHEGDEPPPELDEEEETVQSSEFHVQSSEKETGPDVENPEPGTENPELKT